MSKKIILLGTLSLVMTSCVSRRLYNELDAKYKDCSSTLEQLTAENDNNKSKIFDFEKSNKSLQDQLKKATSELDQLKIEYNQLSQNFQDLDTKSSRVAELEDMLDAQNKNLRKLKDALSKALFEFEGRGLTVEQKNGKVYVSMENKLLFNSGSWAVSTSGRQAVEQLGEVLAVNPDISILIEGHTDNDKVVGNLGGGVNNNWDLSTKRATAIVNILEENARIDKGNLIAAGRSEFSPIASNDTSEGKAKNRRIEVILTPKLDEISKMLNEL